jgi:hypothetical protein
VYGVDKYSVDEFTGRRIFVEPLLRRIKSLIKK